MDQITFEFDELIVPNPFNQYRKVQNDIPSCLDCVNCINCGCHFQKIILPSDDHHQQVRPTIRFKCQEKKCNKIFDDQMQFQNHTKKHFSVYECQYDDCDQTFKIKSNLKRHQKIHTKQKPFLCTQCKRGFATTTNLKQHLQTHLIQNKRSIFQCQVEGCTKKYYYLCNLKKHKKQHIQDTAIIFKTNSYNVMVANCSFTLSATQCTCDGLQKIIIGKKEEYDSKKQDQLQNVLQKGIKQGKLKIGILLNEGDIITLTKFQNLIKWAAQSKMRAIHLSGLKQQTMIQFSQYIIDKVKKSMNKIQQK